MLLGVTLLAGHGNMALAQCNENCPQRRSISVTGTAQVTTDADLAIVHVGYKIYGPDAKTAYGAAVRTSNAIMEALTASGIPKNAIESTSQVLEHTQPYEFQQYPLSNEERAARQFTVFQSWAMHVKPVDASRALNTAITAGANESGWIQWIVNNPTALEARASAKAIANAHIIAEQIARKSGVHLGQLVSAANDNQNFGVAGIAGSVFGIGSASLMAPAAMGPGGQQLAINSRRVEYKLSVNAVYSIE